MKESSIAEQEEHPHLLLLSAECTEGREGYKTLGGLPLSVFVRAAQREARHPPGPIRQ